jgi:hypothetical protein
MTTQNTTTIEGVINSMSRKASLLINARKLNLSSAQLNTYRKIVKGESVTIGKWKTIECLGKKGLLNVTGWMEYKLS